VRERRRAHRVRISGNARLCFGDLRVDLPLADISVSGIGVLVEDDTLSGKPAGQVGICTIDAPDLGEPFEVYVSPMRTRRIGNVRLLGLRFESIDDAELDRIEAYRPPHRGE
jgi:hypothetical protein